MKGKKIFLSLVLFALLTTVGSSYAAEWQWERSVELISPWGSGSGPDLSLRAIQPFLEKELGVSVVINNRPGSAGLVGAEFFINQPADGYSYCIVTTSHVIHELENVMSFSVLNDAEPICILNEDDYLLLASKDAPYDDLLGLRDYAKDKPGELTVACESMGGTDEFLLNVLTNELGIKLTMVPYSSGNEQVAALLGGFVDLIIGAPSETGAYVDSGDAKALGILNQERNSRLPDVKSCKDMGLKTTYFTFRGIIAKKGVPPEALEAMRAAFAKAAEEPGWKQWVETNGLKTDGFGSAEELAQAYAARIEFVKAGKELSSSK